MITMITTTVTTISTITMYQVRHPDGSLAISFPDGSNKRISAGGEEEVAHLTSGTCPTYQDIFEKFDDLSCDEELVKFYSEILARRDAIDEEQ